MATFRLELSNKPTRNRTFPIYLVVSVKSNRKRIKTSIAVNKKSDFNSKARQNNWIRNSEPNSKAWNNTLAKEIENARIEYIRLKDNGQVTSDSVIINLKALEMSDSDIKSQSFLEYVRKKAKETLDAGHISTWKTYNSFINKLLGYLKSINKEDITFNQITPAFISDFQTYLSKLSNERQTNKVIHHNTIHLTLRIFKTFVKRAIDIDKLIKPENNPFILFKNNEIKTSKDKLEMSEIKKISELKLEEGSLKWNCRNYFLFSFYCAGIRIGDLIQLRWSNITSDGRLTYTMGKNHKDRTLILVDQAKEILSYYKKENVNDSSYIFPILDNSLPFSMAINQTEKDTMALDLKKKLFHKISSSCALINKVLKQIALEAGITKKVSFHVARHSFAKVAKQEGIDNLILKDMLNHSSLRTTEIYMKDFDTQGADKALIQIFKKDQPIKSEVNKLIDNMSENEISKILDLIKSINQ